MPLPYYSNENLLSEDAHVTLLILPEIHAYLKGVIKKSIIVFPFPHSGYLCSTYSFIKNHAGDDGLTLWKRTIVTYLEVLELVFSLGKSKELFSQYSAAMDKFIEGQEALFHCHKHVESYKGNDFRIKFKGLLDEYLCLYEGNVKVSLCMAVLALDIIANHPDATKKTPVNYADDDVSYKIQKISKCNHLKLKNDIKDLIKSIEPHIKNAISHQRVEYGEENNIILRDKDGWEKEYKLEDFKKLNLELFVIQLAHNTAMSLFMYEHEESLDFSGVKPYANLKQLRNLIDREIKLAYFEAKDIRFDLKRSEIICDVTKQPGFDSPSTTYLKFRGVPLKEERPALKTDDQALRVMHNIAGLNTEFSICVVNIFEYDGKLLGSVSVNLFEWTKLSLKSVQKKEELDKYILSNSFVR